MLNNVVLVGRLVKDPEITVTENKNKRTYITLAVQRGYKNSNGNYDVDFINCTLWNVIAEHTCEYCKKGDILGIKGRVQTNSFETDGTTSYKLEIIADKVTFLSGSNKNEKVEE